MSMRHLVPLFDRARERSDHLVLATVVETFGSTYTKRGAQMLFARDESYAGMLSGGCLETDLAGHSRSVERSGEPRRVRYDQTRTDDDLLGLGSGCEGTMDILLQRLDAPHRWQPLARMIEVYEARRAESVLLVVRSTDPAIVLGSGIFVGGGEGFGEDAGGIARVAAALAPLRRSMRDQATAPPSLHREAAPGIDVLSLRIQPPPQLLLLGAGPDARPVAQLCAFLDWDVVVIDHRSHYAQREFFPQAREVCAVELRAISEFLAARRGFAAVSTFSAAVVMSHHLESDRGYLRALAASTIPYVGLLGPAGRRDKILDGLGEAARQLTGRLHAPVGLSIGANSPETIALAIAAEIQKALAVEKTVETDEARVRPRLWSQ
jgi:xanthine/CO dehydrogenase XdhC/CoxF family maturation factor